MGDGDFVWAGDDDDPDDSTDAGAEDSQDDPSPDGDPDAASPFEDLLDRIDDLTHDPVEDGRLDDLTWPGDPVDIDRLLERVVEPGEGATATGASPETAARGSSSGYGPPEGLPDAPGDDSDGRETPPPDSAESPSTLHELFDTDVATARPSSGTDVDEANPFEDLAARVESDEAGRAEAGRSSSGGAQLPSVRPDALSTDASGVLVVGHSDEDFPTCQSLLQRSGPERTNLLLVWLSRDVTGRLERLYDTHATPATNVTVVCRSKVGRSIHANPAIPTDAPGGRLSIKRISDPRDLPKLGIAISQVISDWQSHPNQTVMCFHSITDLLQFAAFERVFRFLHVLQGRVDSVDATAHYHVDRDAHDRRTLAMLWNLFDATVDVAGDPHDDD